MQATTNTYAFCADYSSIAGCLSSIQGEQNSGAFAGYPDILGLLNVIEHDLLQQLLNRALSVLATLNGDAQLSAAYLQGDFQDADFLPDDFNTGYNTSGTGYVGLFNSILGLLGELAKSIATISAADKALLDQGLIALLEAFDELRALLLAAGFNPCSALDSQQFNNAANVFIYAAGADGSSGIPAGIHLRWGFAGELGDNHFPRGNYSNQQTTFSGYNQADDYVYISRTPYRNTVRASLDLTSTAPVFSFGKRRWTYAVNQYVNGQLISNRITLTFSDWVQYELLALQHDPYVDYGAFLQAYSGVIQLAVTGKHLMMAGFGLAKGSTTGNAVLKAEAWGMLAGDETTQQLVARQTLQLGAGVNGALSLYGDNIYLINFKKTPGSVLQTISFETYDDFMVTRQPADWTAVGNNGFALSLDDTEVFTRLESAAYPINNRWPQNNTGTTLKTASYQDKWYGNYEDQQSLKSGVSQYLSLSETDPRANQFVGAAGDPVIGATEISYTDVLHFVAADYHLARMLGLGFIDTPAGADTDQYVYRITYTNRASLSSASRITYTGLTLPTSRLDQRLPQQPLPRPVQYGPPAGDDGWSTSFDSNGYNMTDRVRLVNIGRQPFADEELTGSFFNDLTTITNINFSQDMKPVFCGLEYRSAAQPAYQKPAITVGTGHTFLSYDTDHPDGIAEPSPVADDATSLYSHMERQTGVHYYALFGVNIFGALSANSDPVATDDTEFPILNNLQSPPDNSAQYIQLEDTPVLTSQTEQDWLAGRTQAFPGGDVSFTRVIFNWVDIVNVTGLPDLSAAQLLNVAKADQVKLWFRDTLPQQLTGTVMSYRPAAGVEGRLQLFTGRYTYINGSLSDQLLGNETFSKFVGSALTTPEGQFRVVSLAQSVLGPVITVDLPYSVENVEDPNDPGTHGAVKKYQYPGLGSKFMMAENLSLAANWGPLAENIQLYSFDNPQTETTTDSVGNVSTFLVGGIHGDVTIVPQFGSGDPATDAPGVYQISYAAGTSLPPHPQVNLPFDPANPQQNSPATLQGPHVEWYRGVVRVKLAADGTQMKQLSVLRILSLSPLVLYAVDADYQDNPIATAGTVSNVNFHPGYRAYVFPEPAPDHVFNGSTMQPPAGSKIKNSYLSLQAADTRAGGSGYGSALSLPVTIFARRTVVPLPLIPPQNSSARVRPDPTGKAAYTFDLTIASDSSGAAREPFGFMFYRTSNEDVLNALYAAATVSTILAELAALTTDDHYEQRYFELVNLSFSEDQVGHFNVYDGYGFPVPDLPGLTGASDAETLINYQAAIIRTLLPLTAQVPIRKYLKTGFQTENKLPVTRDNFGNLLNVNDLSFDPYPMIRLLPSGPTVVRFTDYTLNASARFLYFYTATEVSDQLVPGLLSTFFGPVSVLHTLPAIAPLVRKYQVGPPLTVSSSPVAVTFLLSPVSGNDNISLIRLFRTTDASLNGSVATMGQGPDIPVNSSDPAGMSVSDDFSDLAAPLLGETVYYRLVGIRNIINEYGQPEEVYSNPSNLVTVIIADSVNPDAPVIGGNGPALSWQPTTKNGTYYLYQQNSKGNWQNIYTVAPPESAGPMSYQFTGPQTDADGNTIYNRFKVRVKNSSGLFNLTDNETTI